MAWYSMSLYISVTDFHRKYLAPHTGSLPPCDLASNNPIGVNLSSSGCCVVPILHYVAHWLTWKARGWLAGGRIEV